MLKTLRFQNYRCFSSHTLPLRGETIIVGRNNAGKSTVIEGLRLVGIITERYKNVGFHDIPEWLEVPGAFRGLRVNLSALSLSWENLFHRYQPPPAIVTAIFENGCEVEIYLGPDRAMYGVLHDPDGKVVRTSGQARSLSLPPLRVLPQVMPLDRKEVVLLPEYVRANMSSYLSARHFRNQLNL